MGISISLPLNFGYFYGFRLKLRLFFAITGDMDSGNSGSLQSSSGGDEDYHESSRGAAAADSFSSFFNHQSYPPAAHVTSFNPPPPPPLPPPAFFDPLASYLDHLSRSTHPNPVLNPADPVWPKDTLITPGPAGFDNSHPSSSNAADRQPDQIPSGIGGARNPRKRTRASRRAPTTVLTTDTTNFRAMVQEFTGIPASPFGSGACSSSLFFPRTRLDLFGGGMNAQASSTSLPPYLLRPLAQKISPPPLVSTVTTTIKNHNSDVIPASSSGGNYQTPSSDLGLLTNLSFASSSSTLLPKYPPDPGSSKPGSGGSLELPITTARNDVVDVQDTLGGLTAGFLSTADAVNSSSAKNNGGPLGWAEGLGLGAGAPAPSSNGSVNNGAPHHSHHRPQNLGFAHQQIG